MVDGVIFPLGMDASCANELNSILSGTGSVCYRHAPGFGIIASRSLRDFGDCSGSPFDQSNLSWTPQPGAIWYGTFRSDPHRGPIGDFPSGT
jgi:hypothetical protein